MTAVWSYLSLPPILLVEVWYRTIAQYIHVARWVSHSTTEAMMKHANYAYK